MIRRVKLEHWRSIEKLDLELGPLTVIVGPNGSGKSNFIDALRFIRDEAIEGLDTAIAKRRGIESIRQWKSTEPYIVRLAIEIDGYSGKAFSLELTSVEDGFRAKDLFANSALRSFFFEAYSIVPGDLRRPQEPHHEARLLAAGENLTSILRRMIKAVNPATQELLEEILSSMRLILPQLRSLRVEGLGGHLVPLFEVEEANGEVHDFNASQISDGTLRMLGLLTALYQPDPPNVIAMEEPEQTLHPGALAILAEAIKDVSQRQQILVTTHSPHFLDHFEPEQIRAAELVNGVTRIRKISPDQISAVRDHLFTLSELMAIEGLHG